MFYLIYIVLVVIVGIYSILNSIKWNEISKFQKLLTCISIVAAIVGGIYTWDSYLKDKEIKNINSPIGKIYANNYSEENEPMQFELGQFFSRNDDGSIYIPSVKKDEICFYAKISNSELFLNIVIRNEKGEIIATIDGHTWKMYKGGYDYNNDDKGFEIVTPDKRVVFQIFLRENIVVIRGLLMFDDKSGLYIEDAPKEGHKNKLDLENGYTVIALPVRTEKVQFAIPTQVPKLSKYPRETNYGVRDYNNPLNN